MLLLLLMLQFNAVVVADLDDDDDLSSNIFDEILNLSADVLAAFVVVSLVDVTGIVTLDRASLFFVVDVPSRDSLSLSCVDADVRGVDDKVVHSNVCAWPCFRGLVRCQCCWVV